MIRCALGQDSHRFEYPENASGKPLVLGGYVIPGFSRALAANSDGDVVLHALTNAISGITCRNILGRPADELCAKGVTDSAAYLKLALADLTLLGASLVHISFSIECKTPHLAAHIPNIRESVASLCGLAPSQVGLTATSGEGLTDFGRGEGISVFCIVTCDT